MLQFSSTIRKEKEIYVFSKGYHNKVDTFKFADTVLEKWYSSVQERKLKLTNYHDSLQSCMHSSNSHADIAVVIEILLCIVLCETVLFLRNWGIRKNNTKDAIISSNGALNLDIIYGGQ